MWRTSKKALACLIVGAVVVLTVVSLAVWAIASELAGNPRSSNNEASNKNTGSTAKRLRPTGSLAEKFILEKTPSDSEGVRIFATVNTGRPVLISQTQLEDERSKMRQSIEDSAVPKELIELHKQVPPAHIDSDSHSTDQHSVRVLPSMKDNRSLDIPSLFDAFNQYFGADLVHEELDDGRSDPPEWLTLSYLSAGIFLLKQTDTLLQLQAANSRARAVGQEPWNYNSLNLLFVEPANGTDVRKALRNEPTPTSVKEYAWAAHNIYTASQQPRSLECIWTAYCEEINNRAPLRGISGAVARMNGVVMEIMSGSLSPPGALNKLARSIFHWDRTDCAALFPKCPPGQAAQYLVQLATTPFNV